MHTWAQAAGSSLGWLGTQKKKAPEFKGRRGTKKKTHGSSALLDEPFQRASLSLDKRRYGLCMGRVHDRQTTAMVAHVCGGHVSYARVRTELNQIGVSRTFEFELAVQAITTPATVPVGHGRD